MHNLFEIETNVYNIKTIAGGKAVVFTALVPSDRKDGKPFFISGKAWNDERTGDMLANRFVEQVQNRDKVLLRGQLRSDTYNDQAAPVLKVQEFQLAGAVGSGSVASAFGGKDITDDKDLDVLFGSNAGLTEEAVSAGKARVGK